MNLEVSVPMYTGIGIVFDLSTKLINQKWPKVICLICCKN